MYWQLTSACPLPLLHPPHGVLQFNCLFRVGDIPAATDPDALAAGQQTRLWDAGLTPHKLKEDEPVRAPWDEIESDEGEAAVGDGETSSGSSSDDEEE